MFFLGLTVSLILLVSGIALLVKSSYVIGGILVASGFILFVLLFIHYRSRRRKSGSQNNAWDCAFVPDCDLPDCDMPDCDVPDCDCSPDCSV